MKPKKNPPEKTSFWCFSSPAFFFDSFLRGFFPNCTMVNHYVLKISNHHLREDVWTFLQASNTCFSDEKSLNVRPLSSQPFFGMYIQLGDLGLSSKESPPQKSPAFTKVSRQVIKGMVGSDHDIDFWWRNSLQVGPRLQL